MADLGGVWLFGCKVKVPHACAELSLRPIGYMLALPVTQSSAAAAVCSLWCCVSHGLSSVAQGYHFFCGISGNLDMSGIPQRSRRSRGGKDWKTGRGRGIAVVSSVWLWPCLYASHNLTVLCSYCMCFALLSVYICCLQFRVDCTFSCWNVTKTS